MAVYSYKKYVTNNSDDNGDDEELLFIRWLLWLFIILIQKRKWGYFIHQVTLYAIDKLIKVALLIFKKSTLRLMYLFCILVEQMFTLLSS